MRMSIFALQKICFHYYSKEEVDPFSKELLNDSGFEVCPPRDLQPLFQDFVRLERSWVFIMLEKERFNHQVFSNIGIKSVS